MQIAAELDVSQVMLYHATFSCFIYESSGEKDMETPACVKYQVGGMLYVEFFLSFSLLFSIIRQKCGTTEMRGDTPSPLVFIDIVRQV